MNIGQDHMEVLADSSVNNAMDLGSGPMNGTHIAGNLAALFPLIVK